MRTYCFGEHEVDENVLEAEPAAVEDEPAPLNVVETDGVDKGGEESSQSAPKLEVGNATRTLCKGPQLDEVSVGQCVVTFQCQQLVAKP